MNPINYIYMSILSICLLVGLAFQKSLKLPNKIVLCYILFTLFTEYIGFYFLYIKPITKINIQLYSFYRPISFVLLSLFFSKIISNTTISKIILLLIPIIFTLSLYFIYIGKEPKFNTQFGLFSKSFLIIYAILYLKQVLFSDENIYLNPYFWTVTGILFFYTGYFFLSGFINYISSKNLELAQKLFSINHLLNIIYYSLVTYGFICQRRLARS